MPSIPVHRTWQKLVIPHELKSLNEFIDALKRNKYAGNRMKQTETTTCALYAKRQLTPITRPVRVTFHWYSKDKRKDLDNVDSARKFILDGLQEANILINDSRRFVADIGKSEFRIDKMNPRVEVLIHSRSSPMTLYDDSSRPPCRRACSLTSRSSSSRSPQSPAACLAMNSTGLRPAPTRSSRAPGVDTTWPS